MSAMAVNEVREALKDGKRLRMVVGEANEDPTLELWLLDGIVMSAGVAGWSAGVVEPVCEIESGFLDEYVTGRFSVEVIASRDQDVARMERADKDARWGR